MILFYVSPASYIRLYRLSRCQKLYQWDNNVNILHGFIMQGFLKNVGEILNILINAGLIYNTLPD